MEGQPGVADATKAPPLRVAAIASGDWAFLWDESGFRRKHSPSGLPTRRISGINGAGYSRAMRVPRRHPW